LCDTKIDGYAGAQLRAFFSGRIIESVTTLRRNWLNFLLSIFTIHMLKITENGANLTMFEHT